VTSTIQLSQRGAFGQRRIWGWALNILGVIWFAAAVFTLALLIALFADYSGLNEMARALGTLLAVPQWSLYAT